ncbi:putative reverse transcriptase domain-containing protein, partial [Tanacetum coccineum]
MMTARNRVGPLPTHHLVVRHSVDYSSLDHFSSDDSSSDSSSSSSLETSSDSPTDALSDSTSRRSSSDHSLSISPSGTRYSHRLCSFVPSVHRSSAISERTSHDSSSVSRSRKRSRSPVAYVPLSSPTLEALSYARADLLPSPKRIRSLETATDLDDCSEDSFEPHVPREVGLGVNFKDESSEPSRSRGGDLEMDVDVVRSDGIEIDPEIQAEIDEFFAYADDLRDRGIDARVVVEAADREESETGTKGLVEVRVARVTHPVMLDDTPELAQEGAVEVIKGAQREQGRRIVGAESTVTILTKRVDELERDNMRLRGTKMPNTRFGASRTREAVNEQSDHRVAEALRVRDAVKNLGPLMGDEVEQEEIEMEETEMEEMEMEETEMEEMEMEEIEMEEIEIEEIEIEEMEMEEMVMVMGKEENMAITSEDLYLLEKKYQVKYASCMLLNSALTWWNSHKRTIGNEAAYAMSWAELMKLMTEVYCPRNEIQKMEAELMVPNEEDRVERFIRGLSDNIQGNMIAVNPVRFQDAVRIANQLMDKKLQGYTGMSAESKRRKERPCTVKCNNNKKVGHLARDCTTTITSNTQRAPVGNQQGVVCYECGRPGHFRKDFPKLRNQNCGNQTRNRVGNKTGGNEATVKAYAIGGGGSNPDSNVVK